MADELPAPAAAGEDRSRVGLALVHRWLLGPGEKDLEGQLAELASAFGAPGAGLGPPEGDAVARVGETRPLPWVDRPEVLQAVRRATTAGRVAGADADWLCAVVQAGGLDWLLWLEPCAGREWTAAEAAALTLAGQALALRLQAEEGSGWVAQVERVARQRRLEEAALVTRRLAHDYGNVLTSILGFTELSLGQVPGETPLKRYLNEIHRAVQQGAQLTNRLRLFARRPAPTGKVVRLVDVLAGEQARAAAWGPDVRLEVQTAADLPPVALAGECLLDVLGPLLDNARESLPGPGTVSVTAQRVVLSSAQCLELWGNASAGEFVRVDIGDDGPGLPAEVRSRLFREPFFTSKPRHRGLGLAIVYGVLHSHGGGFCLLDRPGGGLTARVFLPSASIPPKVPRTAPLDRTLPRGTPAAGTALPR